MADRRHPEATPEEILALQRSSRKWNLFFLIAGTVLLSAVGVGFTVLGAEQVARGKESTSWPSVEGRIVSSRVDISSEPSTGGDSMGYEANVLYRYSVDGAGFESRRISFTGLGRGKKSARAAVARYPKGKKVQVFHDPMDPASAVLETGTSTGAYLFPIAGAAMLVVALILGVVTTRMLFFSPKTAA